MQSYIQFECSFNFRKRPNKKHGQDYD